VRFSNEEGSRSVSEEPVSPKEKEQVSLSPFSARREKVSRFEVRGTGRKEREKRRRRFNVDVSNLNFDTKEKQEQKKNTPLLTDCGRSCPVHGGRATVERADCPEQGPAPARELGDVVKKEVCFLHR